MGESLIGTVREEYCERGDHESERNIKAPEEDILWDRAAMSFNEGEHISTHTRVQLYGSKLFPL